jgi:hypothetical protein
MLDKMHDFYIVDLYTVNPFFVIELKNRKKNKIEINKLHKISINVVKRKKILSSLILMGLLILDLAYIDSFTLKIAATFFLMLLFVAVFTFYSKQYIMVIELKNKEKLRYIISFRKKFETKEKIIHIRDLQFKHNFKD